MSNHFGAGIYLTSVEDRNEDGDELWDLKVDNTGDIKTVSGIDELLKDVAFTTAYAFDRASIGRVLDNDTLTSMQNIYRRVINQDPRLQRILYVDIRRTENNRVTVDSQVNSPETDVDLIFEVEV